MYDKVTLKNGVRVVIENIPYVRSVSVGIWIKTGSRDEDEVNNGISHFIEHMLFKGTNKRSAKDIAEQIDSVGGQLNAFTSKECTCYYAKILDNHLPIAIDILSDMFFNSKFDENEIDKEKGVILEEICMYEDAPDDLVHDLLSKTIFEGSSLSLPVLGTKESLKNINRDIILRYLKKHYIPKNTVIAIAGKVDKRETIKLIEQYFGDWDSEVEVENNTISLDITRKISSKIKSTEQLHLCLGMQGIAQGNYDMYPLHVLSNTLGGSMSSRLFQKLREDMGLVYSIYSYPSSYKDIGTFTIYAGLNANQLLNASELIMKEINEIKSKSISKIEINKAKEQLKGNYILGLESTSSRMTSLGKSELLLGKVYSQQEIIQKIDNVNKDSVNSIIDKVLDVEKFNISYVGNIEDNDINMKIDKIFR